MFHSDDDFSTGMSCSKMPESFSSLTQRVAFINDRYDLTRFHKLLEHDQILLVRFRRETSQPLAPGFRHPTSQEHGLEDLSRSPPNQVDGCRMNFYQDFILLGRRFFHLLELKAVRGAVFCADNRFRCSYSSRVVSRQLVGYQPRR